MDDEYACACGDFCEPAAHPGLWWSHLETPDGQHNRPTRIRILDDPHVGPVNFSHSLGREQIALSIILTLSWHKTHLAKAEIAHRTDALARQTAKRLHMVKRLLDIR